MGYVLLLGICLYDRTYPFCKKKRLEARFRWVNTINKTCIIKIFVVKNTPSAYAASTFTDAQRITFAVCKKASPFLNDVFGVSRFDCDQETKKKFSNLFCNVGAVSNFRQSLTRCDGSCKGGTYFFRISIDYTLFLRYNI